ncbi:YggT family protein [Bartonella sp. DGB1]|uniref:YggT family protein n=1 Tax=Bartonella sp. DGB1 TaxID=3239807 RepID=UPI003524F992
MLQVYEFLDWLLSLYILIIVLNAIFSWLYVFGVINPYNSIAKFLANFFNTVTEPVLQPIRRILPDLGFIDISPIVLIVLLHIVRRYILPALFF